MDPNEILMMILIAAAAEAAEAAATANDVIQDSDVNG